MFLRLPTKKKEEAESSSIFGKLSLNYTVISIRLCFRLNFLLPFRSVILLDVIWDYYCEQYHISSVRTSLKAYISNFDVFLTLLFISYILIFTLFLLLFSSENKNRWLFFYYYLVHSHPAALKFEKVWDAWKVLKCWDINLQMLYLSIFPPWTL